MKTEKERRPSAQDLASEPPHQGRDLHKRGWRDRVITLHPTVLVLATYVLLLLSKLIDIALINRENRYYSVVILQMMIFLIPGAIWCSFSGERYVSGLRLRPIRTNSLLLIASAAVLMSAGGILISVLFGGLDSLSESFSLYDTFVSTDDGTASGAIYLIMAYAVLPAICEEFVFRGILCREYERGGVLRAIVLSSVFFSLLHFNLANLPVYLFSGAILALTFYATRSLLGSILAHFLYNIFGIFGQPYINNLYQITGSTRFFLFLVTVCFLVSAALFCGEAARLYRQYLWRAYSADYRKPSSKGAPTAREAYLSVIRQPSAIACFAVYIIALVISWI